MLQGIRKLETLETRYIQPILPESSITMTGNVQCNGNIVVSDTLHTDIITSGIFNGNVSTSSSVTVTDTLKTSNLDPQNTDITINGDVSLISDAPRTWNLLGNTLISYDTSPPPSNYTTHYGPMVQGTYVLYSVATSYALSSTLSRNGITQYYNDISALTISINKKYASSKIKYTISCSSEVFENSVGVIRRFDSSDVFEAELGVPTLDGTGRVCH